MEKQIAVRLEETVLDALDARAKDVGLSRNEWLNRSVKWMLQSLPARADAAAAHTAALAAPAQVAGRVRVPMGLDTPDGVVPK